MNAPRQPQDDRTASPLVYILIFTSFALFALTIFSDRIAKRQTRIEQQFHGIEQMQRGGPAPDGRGQGDNLRTPDEQPLIITLRPLMLSLALVMLVAWAILMWRRLRTAAPTPSTPTPSTRNDE